MISYFPQAMNLRESESLYERALIAIGGGVTSAARRSPAGNPVYMERGSGPHLWDVDGNRYIDFALGFGTCLLGHAAACVREAVHVQLDRALSFGGGHRHEVEASELLVSLIPNAEQCLFSSTGTDAVLAAVRIARAVTGRAMIIKMEGSYHGSSDALFVNVWPDVTAGDLGANPAVHPESEGMSPGTAADVLVAPYNDLAAVEQLLTARGDEIACVVVEPVQSMSGCIGPVPGYLEGLRAATRKSGSLLIFDEVITGFRLALGGGQQFFGVDADLATFGKAMAGGMPLSAVAGSRDVMEPASSYRVHHAGTFNGNPLACAAGVAAMTYFRDNAAALYPRIHELGERLAAGWREVSPRLSVRGVGPMQYLSVGEPAAGVRAIRDLHGGDYQGYLLLARQLLRHGVHLLAAKGLCYVSACHEESDIDAAVAALAEALAELPEQDR